MWATDYISMREHMALINILTVENTNRSVFMLVETSQGLAEMGVVYRKLKIK